MRRAASFALGAAALALAGCMEEQLTGIATGVGEPPLPRPAATPETATFTLEPFPGMPGNIADNLTRRIWRRAEGEGLTIVKRPGGRALFTIDGVLTAISDDNNALVFYVFDIKDVSGRRLHRISGEQHSQASDGDPWAGVADRDLDLIAIRLTALIRAWLNAPAPTLPTRRHAVRLSGG